MMGLYRIEIRFLVVWIWRVGRNLVGLIGVGLRRCGFELGFFAGGRGAGMSGRRIGILFLIYLDRRKFDAIEDLDLVSGSHIFRICRLGLVMGSHNRL